MRLYFHAALIYAVCAILLLVVRHGDAVDLVAVIGGSKLRLVGTFAYYWLLPFVIIQLLFMGFAGFLQRSGQVVYALFGAVVLQFGFSIIKTSIPDIVPYYDDAFLATLDRALHGGIDPWRLAHALGPKIWANHLLPVYLYLWSACVLLMPSLVALTDGDPVRVRRFVILRLGIWIVLGNVFALAFSSVGPVDYDALLGGDRFADLTAALKSSGVEASAVGRVQAALWQGYLAHSLEFASGVSAFPSVHVAIATSTAIYMGERSCWLILPGVLFTAIIQFLSVYTGYHYAIDGYVSIVLVIGAWLVLLRLQRRSPALAAE